VAQGPIARKLLSLKSPSTLARIAGHIAIAGCDFFHRAASDAWQPARTFRRASDIAYGAHVPVPPAIAVGKH
jgi:hypothetical protein